MKLYTRQSGSANFNTTTYDKAGNWAFPGTVTANGVTLTGSPDLSGFLPLSAGSTKALSGDLHYNLSLIHI